MKLIVITPFYNEGKYLRNYLNSIVKQISQPTQLIMVDDNSTDDSAQIVREFARNHSWIKYIYHASANNKSQGKKVIQAFNFGLKQCDLSQFDLISKIDADLEFPSNYFYEIKLAFSKNPRLGISGGIILEENGENWEPIRQASYHIRGALKSYRKTCFEQINGIQPVLGWDGLDEMAAMHKKWQTQIITIGVKHFRPASKDYNKEKLNYDIGFANYKNGGGLFLALIRTTTRCLKRPYFKIGLAFYRGYFTARKKKTEKNVDEELAKFINQFHLRRLFQLKRY